MDPQFGLARNTYRLSKSDKADISEMTLQHRILLHKPTMSFMVVSNPKSAINLNMKCFNGEAAIITRTAALRDYPEYFYFEEGKCKQYKKKIPIGLYIRKELADYVRSKPNITAYIERLIELDMNGQLNQ